MKSNPHLFVHSFSVLNLLSPCHCSILEKSGGHSLEFFLQTLGWWCFAHEKRSISAPTLHFKAAWRCSAVWRKVPINHFSPLQYLQRRLGRGTVAVELSVPIVFLQSVKESADLLLPLHQTEQWGWEGKGSLVSLDLMFSLQRNSDFHFPPPRLPSPQCQALNQCP